MLAVANDVILNNALNAPSQVPVTPPLNISTVTTTFNNLTPSIFPLPLGPRVPTQQVVPTVTAVSPQPQPVSPVSITVQQPIPPTPVAVQLKINDHVPLA